MKRLLLIVTAAFIIGMSCTVNAQESIDNLYVSPTGWARWTTATSAFEGFYEDFESGALPAGWTVYQDDASASPNSEWHVALQSSFGGFSAYDGTQSAFSNGSESHGVSYYMVTHAINFEGSAYLNYYYIAPDYWGDVSTLKVAYSNSPTGPWNDLWSTAATSVSAWTENTIDLSSLNGTYYLAFIDVNDFGYCVAVDNVSLTETRDVEYYSVKLNGAVVGTTENKYFQLDTENLVDGQIYTASVAVKSGTGMSEYVDYQFTYSSPENYQGVTDYTCEIVGNDVIMSWTMPEEVGAMVFMDGELLTENPLSTCTYTVEGPLEGTVELCVRTVITDEESNDYYAMSVPQCESVNTECPAPKDLYGEYFWDGGTLGTKLIWPYGGTEGSVFVEGFENGIPSDWATIDADGDGYNWTLGSIAMAGYNIHSHTGEDMVVSHSYIGSTPLHPDNYLVTPRVNIVEGSKLSFWACGHDENNVAEHVGVAVSTGIQTNPDDFVTVAEWTMHAKGVGTYYQYEVDLSAYAGQKVYLAIRHFNCTDQFILDVDDMELSVSDTKSYASEFSHYNIYRDEVKIAETTSNSYFDILEQPGDFKYQVTSVYLTDNGECESGFAKSYENPENDYVMVTVTSVYENEVENIIVYPNPVNNVLNINAEGMTKIEFFDIVGKKVYENAINTDESHIDVSGFESGVYVVKVSTTKGDIVKRISIVR